MTPKLLPELSNLATEQRNNKSMEMDQMSTSEILKMINDEDQQVALAVKKVLPEIGAVVDLIHEAFLKGGRLFYVGAGSSGRLAVLDASECTPTFMTSQDMVQAIMAGGEQAFLEAAENAEDDDNQAGLELEQRNLGKHDVVVGITASGRTPYPIGALKYANKVGCASVSLTCNSNSVISQYADFKIEVLAGQEVLTGSTRMKAGTAHKMVLNMISTATMVKMGKVYENLMVDVHASNEKLRERAKQIVMEITGVNYEEAEKALEISDQKVKPAIVMLLANVSSEQADTAIKKSGGHARSAIEYAKKRR
ncbi:MAG TPA: N-acetylmuramic acid 6-phosphate etherase [Bacillales bacterium]|nr:N-acetylmuramic acid 6-phosphate etherase [Bacillales bacterium]